MLKHIVQRPVHILSGPRLSTHSLPRLQQSSARALHLRPTLPTMARKSARAIAAAEAASPSNHSDDDSSAGGKVSLSDLTPKSCLTCGRVISPRAKWAKDWAGIKYCSDRCRSTRPGKVVVKFTADSNDVSSLRGLSGVTVEESEVRVDVETFIEGVLLDVAGRKGSGGVGGTLEDVQEQLRSLLKDASISIGEEARRKDDSSDPGSGNEGSADNEHASTGNVHPLWKALDGPPGLRERIRRAARRLALGLTHETDSKQTNITTTEGGSIELTQGGKVLRTVQDLSFAKGVIHIRRKK